MRKNNVGCSVYTSYLNSKFKINNFIFHQRFPLEICRIIFLIDIIAKYCRDVAKATSLHTKKYTKVKHPGIQVVIATAKVVRTLTDHKTYTQRNF